MFVPKRFESALPWRELLARHDFGAMLTADGEDLFATHVPYLVDAERRTLTTHLARANPHWQAIERQPRCRLIVQGAHGYVSPQWYATKESVPTWDYEVVHVEGTAALDPATSAAYVVHRVRIAGGGPAVFASDALASLHELSGGVPGLMNTLADNALFEAFLCGRSAVTATDVVRAHRDLSWDVESGTRAAPPARREPTPPRAQAAVTAPVLRDGPKAALEAFDSDLDMAFTPPAEAEATVLFDAPQLPDSGPPKDEEEDLFAELLDD